MPFENIYKSTYYRPCPAFECPRPYTRTGHLFGIGHPNEGALRPGLLRQTEGTELLAWLERRSHRLAIAKAAVDWHFCQTLTEPDLRARLSW